jgi:HK97 family phage major capsid protein
VSPPVFPRSNRRRSSYEAFRAGEAAPELSAFWRWATSPMSEGEEDDAKQALPEVEYRTLSKSASGGGFFVPADLAETVIAAARAESAVAQVALEIVTDRGESLGMPLAGTHGSAAWVAESGAISPSDETITQNSLAAHKAVGKIIVSEELRTDSAVELDSYLGVELGARLGALQESAFTLGDGSGKPLGITHASSGYTIVTAATGSATTFKLADIKTVFKALPLAYRRNASWLINGDDFGELAALTDSAGGLVLPSLQFDPPSLFGRPVFISGDLPAPGAKAKSLAFGDWKRAYGIRRVNGVDLRKQFELHSDAGHIGYRSVARVGGRPLLTDAARILAHSAT